jgi:2-dehydro-3-deoxyphosphogluconate aldolase / (4S)-4-hydroxy-2-oxoglutarate aldolase
MNEHPSLERIKALPIFAAVSAPSADSALKSASAAIAGGLTQIEIRLSSPGAYRVISDLRREHGDAVLVGAGSVVTSEMADRAIKAGAQFLSSPHTDDGILTACRERGLLAIAGALTPTEVMHAWNLGCPLVCVNPAGPFGGPAYVHWLADAFEDVRLMPSGGVSNENLRDYIRAGARAATIGAGLFSTADVQTGSYGRITDRAKALVKMYAEIVLG